MEKRRPLTPLEKAIENAVLPAFKALRRKRHPLTTEVKGYTLPADDVLDGVPYATWQAPDGTIKTIEVVAMDNGQMTIFGGAYYFEEIPQNEGKALVQRDNIERDNLRRTVPISQEDASRVTQELYEALNPITKDDLPFTFDSRNPNNN